MKSEYQTKKKIDIFKLKPSIARKILRNSILYNKNHLNIQNNNKNLLNSWIQESSLKKIDKLNFDNFKSISFLSISDDENDQENYNEDILRRSMRIRRKNFKLINDSENENEKINLFKNDIKSKMNHPKMENKKIVEMNYNGSNTPKFFGKFNNVMVNNKLKRECKKCSVTYNDLKGFNRHYQSIHLNKKTQNTS